MTADLVLFRDIFTTKMTLGTLYYKGSPLLLAGNKIYVGEDVARPDGVKIEKETAIWAGDDYFIKMTLSNRFGIVLPLIYNDEESLAVINGAKRFDGVRQHNGNTEADTDACQLMGLGRSNAGVWSSHDALNLYLPWITKLVSDSGGKIPYQIINKQT